MRTAYVVLGLLMLSAASSYGFDFGMMGGARDLSTTSRYDERFTPLLTVTAGRIITQKLPVRIDAMASAWTRERRYQTFDDVLQKHVDDRSEKAGYAFGVRVLFDKFMRGAGGGRLIRPYFGGGVHWAANKTDIKLWGGRGGEEFWYDRVEAEGILGIAIPYGTRGDFLIQYMLSGPIDFGNPNVKSSESGAQSVSLGCRFSVI